MGWSSERRSRTGILGACACALFLAALLAGCSLSYRRFHESRLLSLYAAVPEPASKELYRFVPSFEDQIVLMADEFGIPLQEVIPVRAFVDDQGSGKSYFNRITRTIVLRGPPEPLVFVHELSHLLTHHLVGAPPYWADEALADYMERYIASRPHAAGVAAPAAEKAVAPDDPSRLLIRRVAEAKDPAEVVAHLSSRAMKEDRGWGEVVARYFFEARWSKLPTPEKVRLFLQLNEEDVARCAPDILEFCRRPDLLAAGGG